MYVKNISKWREPLIWVMAIMLMVCIGVGIARLIFQFGSIGGWRFEVVEEKVGTIVELGQCANRSKGSATCAWGAKTADGLIYRTTGSPKVMGQQINILVYRDNWGDPNKLYFTVR